MTARKCDRCKAYCDFNSERSEVKIVARTGMPIEVDLCPDCTTQLLCWIKNKAELFERKET